MHVPSNAASAGHSIIKPARRRAVLSKKSKHAMSKQPTILVKGAKGVNCSSEETYL